MLFTELRFLVFFLAVLGVYWRLRNGRHRKYFLLGASYWFYGAWNPYFLLLILFSTLVDYLAALGIVRSPGRRRRYLALSLVVNLGALGICKYFNFFLESAYDLLALFGDTSRPVALSIVLPVGISFYTFQTLSYTIDVYRGTLQPRRDLLDVALFVAFFPQLVAGPIMRAADFLPQLGRSHRFRDVDVRAALVLFLVGFFKKACVSDNLAGFVDGYFQEPGRFDGLSAWLGTCGYAIQIYCDFSGYSDMAVAAAALLGYQVCRNFDFPYFARSVSEFWRRWHISLSTWLRDYLYIPLGGGRGTRARVARNLMLTMLLGGLWHGAAWNFVIWGGLHGLALIVQRLWRAALPSERFLPGWLALPLTFSWVCLAWVFFRAPSLEEALKITGRLLFLDLGGEERLSLTILLPFALLLLLHWVAYRPPIERWWRGGPAWVFTVGYALAVAVVVPFVSVDYDPFIYFQF